MSVISAAEYRQNAEFLNVKENPALKRVTQAAATRQQLMRRIGAFELIDGEYVGHIATLNFKCKAVIKANPYRALTTDADFIVEQLDAEVFAPELGFAWEKTTEGQNMTYLSVHLDDPSFAKTIVAVLVHARENMYFLYWDRVTITEGEIEKMLITEELQPYTGVFRRISKVTDYLISIYPSLQEIWEPD